MTRAERLPAQRGAGGGDVGGEEPETPSSTKEYSDTVERVGFNQNMKLLRSFVVVAIALGIFGTLHVSAQKNVAQPQPAAAEQLLALANQSRSRTGAGALKWDTALAEAAMKHCMRMVSEGPIAHRYGGEPDLTTRAAQAGAHFSLIEENVAIGSYPQEIHEGWMNSPGHRTNLLNPEVDRVGIAVVAARGVLYAVADYARAVPVMTPSQVESSIASLIRMSGVNVSRDPTDARAACALDRGLPRTHSGTPKFVMRWQGADLQHLPQELVNRLANTTYSHAEVGSCAPRDAQASFTVYRIAVLLY